MAAEPVFIFLPVRDDGPKAGEVRVDPVCGRLIDGVEIAGQLRHSGRQHYFCSLACAERFAAAPSQFGPR